MNINPCPVCESPNTRLYLDDKDETLDPSLFGSSRAKITHGRILRCADCGFGFRQVRSNSEEMAQLYRRMDVAVYESETEGRRSTARRHFALLQKFYPGSPGRLLDVGCASGYFLREARQAGWSVTGLEPSEILFGKAVETLGDKGQVICSTLEHADLPLASFDVLSLWDVLEHVPDPSAFLKTCFSLLKPGGKLLLNVPNLDSREARLLGNKWPLFLAEHLNYFNRNSLQLCASKAGLQWQYFGGRPVSFSVGYILFRLSQHDIPGSSMLRRFVRGSAGRIMIPIYLGEIFGVWSR